MSEFNGRLDEQAAVARARAAISPTAADAQRVKVALEAALAAGPPAGAAGSARAAGAPPAVRARWGGSSLSTIGLTAGLTALLAGGAGYLAGHRAGQRDAPAPSAPVPAMVVEVPASDLAPAATVAEAAPIPLARTQATSPLTSVPAPARRIVRAAHAETGGGGADPSLDQEVRALRGVERALRDRRPGLALALLAALDRDVPGGKLVEEREAMLVIARCAQGEAPIRVELEGAFAGRYPGSVYLERVQQACGPRSATGEQRIGAGAETEGKQEATP